MKNFFGFFIFTYFLSLSICLAQQKGKSEGILMVHEEGNGLKADYYNGSNFEEKVFSRIDEEINFYYINESPAPGVNTENYSIRWTGSLYAPVTGKYKIIVRVDDGIRLWVNDVKVLDQWKLQQTTTYIGHLNLEEGRFYSLKIEYFNEPREGVLQLMWESPEDKITSFFGLFEETPRKLIPMKYLFGKAPEDKGPSEEEQAKSPALEKEEQVSAVSRKRKEKKKEEKLPEEEGGIVRNMMRESLPEKNSAPAEIKPGKAEKDLAPAELEPEPVEPDFYENLQPGEIIHFENVEFEQGKYTLLEGCQVELDKLARTMIKYPALKIRIEGHTDNVGDPIVNQSLSLFRAKAVATHLQESGIDVSRMKVNGNGSDKPLADNYTEAGREKNRRVEIVVQ